MGANVYIIAGPNGAGKTTFARTFLPLYASCTNFINADLIAQGVSPLRPEAAAVRAGRLMLEEIERYRKQGIDFSFETTLSGKTQLAVVKALNTGYSVHLFYLWLPSVELALSRVAGRVLKGGHNVPEADVRRRFERSGMNFFTDYRQFAQSWYLFDNSGYSPVVIAFFKERKLHIIERAIYADLVARYGSKHEPHA